MRAIRYGILALHTIVPSVGLRAHVDTAPAQVTFSMTDQVSEATSRELGLRVRLIAGDTGRTIPGCIRIRAAGDPPGPWLRLDPLLPRGMGLNDKYQDLEWYVLTEEAEIAVPESKIEIEAYSGIRFERRVLEVGPDTVGPNGLEIALQPLFDPAAEGWVAGNTHLHLRRIDREMADRYLVDVSRTEGLEMVFVSYLERAVEDLEYISNSYQPVELERLSTSHLVFGPGEEYRHNFGSGGEGYGHVMFLNLAPPILPASIGPGITEQGTDSIPLRPAIVRARDLGATIVWCHNQFGLEDIPCWIDGLIDAMNIFDGGSRGTYEETFYRYLNLGLKVPFSTGTDWFINDHSRVYVRMDGEHRSDHERWLVGLRRGETFITNGALLEFSVDRVGPGAEIDLEQPETLYVRGRAVSRHDFGTLEVVHNGKVIRTVPAFRRQGGPGFDARIRDWPVRVEGSGWIALRIKPAPETLTEMARPLFGHTGPVYIRFDGNLRRDPDAVDHLVRELRRSQDQIREQGSFSDSSEPESILSIYQSALSKLTNATAP
jgi:hypothetical protein